MSLHGSGQDEEKAEEQILLISSKSEDEGTKKEPKTRIQKLKQWCGEFFRAEHVLIDESLLIIH